MEPPAPSIMARAPLLTRISFSETLRSSLPERITFAPSARRGTMPASFSTWRLISEAPKSSSSLVRTSAMSSRVSELKPRLGRRRCSGICPPSKPTLWKPPERAFWPLWPRPAVLPQPEPPPRPSRCRSLFAPGAGFNEFSLMSVLDANQVVLPVNHTAPLRPVCELGNLVDALQTQPAHGIAVSLLAAAGALDELHPDFIHPVISSTDLPRRAAISAGVLIA